MAGVERGLRELGAFTMAVSSALVTPGFASKASITAPWRVCAFPDNFVLVGSYAQQWARLGNAVPPVMMMRISAAVRDGVLSRVSGRTTQAET